MKGKVCLLYSTHDREKIDWFKDSVLNIFDSEFIFNDKEKGFIGTEIIYEPKNVNHSTLSSGEYSRLISECFDSIRKADIVMPIIYNRHMGTGLLYELNFALSYNKEILIYEIKDMYQRKNNNIVTNILDFDTLIEEKNYRISSLTNNPELDLFIFEIEEFIMHQTEIINNSNSCTKNTISMINNYIDDNNLDIEKVNVDTIPKLVCKIDYYCNTIAFIIIKDSNYVPALEYLLDDLVREIKLQPIYVKYKNEEKIKSITYHCFNQTAIIYIKIDTDKFWRK